VVTVCGYWLEDVMWLSGIRRDDVLSPVIFNFNVADLIPTLNIETIVVMIFQDLSIHCLYCYDYVILLLCASINVLKVILVVCYRAITNFILSIIQNFTALLVVL
jgi:hypothetical protein